MAYLSGKQSASGQPYGTYSQDDIDALRALAEEPGIVDIFLTYPCILLYFNSLLLASLPPNVPLYRYLRYTVCILNYILLMIGPVGS